jgi:hypothetical protein
VSREAEENMPDDVVERIEAIPDVGRRLRAVTEQMAISQREVLELGRLRKALIEQLHREGHSFSQIGSLAGLSRGRVHQLLNAGPPVESRFFGRSPVTIAFPLRALPGREEDPVISSEDARSVDLLAGILTDLAFEVSRYPIPVDGQWQPRTASTVAICGPKSSPVVAEAIALDPLLSFAPDDQGRWVITDRQTGDVYASPLDTGRRDRSADVAYVARLPFGRRQVLVVAGIHSLGSIGAIQHIGNNLATLYDTVGTAPFSMIVASRHHGDTITHTEALCPPRLHPSA